MNDMNAVFGHQGTGIDSIIPIRIAPNDDHSTVRVNDFQGLQRSTRILILVIISVHHFWFYVQVAYYYGKDAADLGNLYHETLDTGGKSMADYLLALLGAELGKC